MRDQRTYLKIKIKSLAAEAKIIRAEEKKHTKHDPDGYNPIRTGLREHRVHVVRSECRHTLLAYGFMRGRSYHQIEPSSDTKPDWARVQKMVDKYGSAEQRKNFETWKAEAVGEKSLVARGLSAVGDLLASMR